MTAVFLTTPHLADRMAEAARQLAWVSRIDVTIMDGLIRKVARGASDALVTRAILASVNDDEEEP